jgi:hypothetical protein
VSIGNGTEKKSKVEITKELLHQKYSYCPIDIAQPLVHRNGSRKTKRGDPAGTLVQSYYRMGNILETRSMSIHRAVWLYKHPGCYKESEVPPIIDHINMNKQDNRYENLRPVSSNFNAFNRKRPEGGSSYYRGVSLIKTSGRWKASIRMGGKRRHIGTFPGGPEGEIAAALAWDRAAFKLYGEDAIPSLNFPDDKANYMGLNSNEQLEFGFIVGNGNDRQQHLDFSALLGTGTEDGGVRRI